MTSVSLLRDFRRNLRPLQHRNTGPGTCRFRARVDPTHSMPTIFISHSSLPRAACLVPQGRSCDVTGTFLIRRSLTRGERRPAQLPWAGAVAYHSRWEVPYGPTKADETRRLHLGADAPGFFGDLEKFRALESVNSYSINICDDSQESKVT